MERERQLSLAPKMMTRTVDSQQYWVLILLLTFVLTMEKSVLSMTVAVAVAANWVMHAVMEMSLMLLLFLLLLTKMILIERMLLYWISSYLGCGTIIM
jgi:hypothetical protein